MNLHRLKFANARGARIQIDERLEVAEVWRHTVAPVWSPMCDYRIHPDDERLQYGPLSAVMLEWARAPVFTTVSANASTEWHAARHFWLAARFPTDIDGGAPSDYSMTETECRMLALFMAEVMADEGL